MKTAEIHGLTNELRDILGHLYRQEEKHSHLTAQISPIYQQSAVNLIHYLALRTFDIRELQRSLGYLGLTRLARAEAHVENSLRSTLFYLEKRIGEHPQVPTGSAVTIKKSEKLSNKHTERLLGPKPLDRRLRIMVTIPSEASNDQQLVEEMVEAGMDCARINCAHDDPATWLKMIENIRTASRKSERDVRIAMDLGGPKIRTGEIMPGPKMKRFIPQRNLYGQVNKPAIIRFVPDDKQLLKDTEIPVERSWLNHLQIGDVIHFSDTRDKNREVKVTGRSDEWVQVELYDSAYLISGLTLESGYGKTVIGDLPAFKQAIYLKEGDELVVYKKTINGKPETQDAKGHIIAPASISTTLPEVLDKVSEGQSIYFDDGKLKGKIIMKTPDYLKVQMTQIKGGGAGLKSDKGINFPDSDLGIDGLTIKDKEDLKFIVKYADIVNFSFVNTPKDVEDLYAELKQLHVRKKFGVILKIENKKGYDNLTDILLTAMRHDRIGVMIARGDLAIEVGWNDIGMIQREILAICNACHVPVVWATQVLENLAKKGMPSRAEITDVVNGIKSECIMLNKGPHILVAIRLLNEIIERTETYQNKNAAMLPRLEKISSRASV